MSTSDLTVESRPPGADLDAVTERLDALFAKQAALNDLCIEAFESLHAALSRALDLALQYSGLEVADLAAHVAKEQAGLHFLLRDLTNRLEHPIENPEPSVIDDAS